MEVEELEFSFIRRFFQFILQILLLPVSLLEFMLSPGLYVMVSIGSCGYNIIFEEPSTYAVIFACVIGFFICIFFVERIYRLHLSLKQLIYIEGDYTDYGTKYVNKEVSKDIKDSYGKKVGSISSIERVAEPDFEYHETSDDYNSRLYSSFAFFLRLYSIFMSFIACFNKKIIVSYVIPKGVKNYDRQKFIFCDIIKKEKNKKTNINK